MTIKAIKLISGEEIFGEVMSEDDKEIVIKNPLAIVLRQDQNGNLGVNFLPFAPYLGKGVTFEFALDKCLFVKEVDVQMRNQYNTIFGGLITPAEKKIAIDAATSGISRILNEA